MAKAEIELGTMLLVIQLLQDEMEACRATLTEDSSPDDQVWYYDLERAAEDLEQAYAGCIADNQIINFPTYERLIARRRPAPPR